MSSKKKIDELVAKAKTYGYSGVSRNEKTLNAWIRNAEYLYESSVKYLGWNRKYKKIYKIKLNLEKLAKEDEIWESYHKKSGIDWDGIMTYYNYQTVHPEIQAHHWNYDFHIFSEVDDEEVELDTKYVNKHGKEIDTLFMPSQVIREEGK